MYIHNIFSTIKKIKHIIIIMKLTLEEIYQITKNSLEEKENWQWKENYRTYKNGIGIPYEITNEKIGITIWIGNWYKLQLKINESESMYLSRRYHFDYFYPLSSPTTKNLPHINLYRRWTLYRLAMKIFTDTQFEINIDDDQIIRDIKLNKLIK